MITLLPDFTEEERIYWKNIEEIQEYKDIIKHYDKLLLIRLKSFIEGQINSREFQCFLFLEKISHKETFASWEYQEENIKIKLGNIKLNGTQFTNYLKSSEIEKVNELIQYLLKVSHQYCCSYRLLKLILDLIYLELNENNSIAGNIPILIKEEEVSSKKINEKAIYFKPNGKEYFSFQIAFFAYYQKLKINNPKYDTNYNKLKVLASEFNLTSETSAQRIFDSFYRPIIKSFEEEEKPKKIFEAISLKTEISYKTIKKHIEEILPLLNAEGQNEAKEHIVSLDLLIN